MSGFLVIHVLHEGSEVRVRFVDRRGLRSINEGCSELACVVDAESGIEELFLLGGERFSACTLGFVEACWLGLGSWGGRGGCDGSNRDVAGAGIELEGERCKTGFEWEGGRHGCSRAKHYHNDIWERAWGLSWSPVVLWKRKIHCEFSICINIFLLVVTIPSFRRMRRHRPPAQRRPTCMGYAKAERVSCVSELHESLSPKAHSYCPLIHVCERQ